MSPYRFRRIDRQAAEQLLRGQPVRGSESLHELLAAAAAPPAAGELPGEQAAMAAFRAAHLAHAPQQRRRPVLKSTLATLLTAKILIPAAAAATAGGIAVAATTGVLPFSGDTPTVVPQISQSHSPSSASRPPTAPPGKPDDPGKPADSGNPADSAPSPSLTGLCQAYTAQAGSERGKALDSPAFTVLITTAGGKDKVDGYCATLLDPKNAKPATPPGGGPNPHPTGPPDPAHPIGRPTAPPDAKPSTPPRPTDVPAPR